MAEGSKFDHFHLVSLGGCDRIPIHIQLSGHILGSEQSIQICLGATRQGRDLGWVGPYAIWPALFVDLAFYYPLLIDFGDWRVDKQRILRSTQNRKKGKIS